VKLSNYQHRPGEIVQLSVFENGREKDYNLTLRNVYGNTKIVSENDEFYVKRLGAAFDQPDAELMEDLNITYGIQITAIRSGILSSKGISKGFIIQQMNKKEINSISDIRDVISKVKGGLLIEGIYPNGQRVYYGIGL